MEESAQIEQGGQVSQPSIEDRLVKQFGLSAEPDPEQAEVSEPEQPDEVSEPETETSDVVFEEVDYEGKVYQVPTEIKNALMSRADYTRKTQETARQREALEIHQRQIQELQQQHQFEQTLQEELGRLGSLNYVIQQYQSQDWAKLSGDELTRAGLQLKQLEDQRKAITDSVAQKRAAFTAEYENRKQALLQQATEVLRKAIPGWGEATAAEVSEYALAQGFTQHEVNNIYNPRDVTVLWKAQQYDKLISSKGDALKKASKAPPVVKPGSVKPMPKDVRDKLDFRKAMKKASTSQEKARVIHQNLTRKLERSSKV